MLALKQKDAEKQRGEGQDELGVVGALRVHGVLDDLGTGLTHRPRQFLLDHEQVITRNRHEHTERPRREGEQQHLGGGKGDARHLVGREDVGSEAEASASTPHGRHNDGFENRDLPSQAEEDTGEDERRDDRSLFNDARLERQPRVGYTHDDRHDRTGNHALRRDT